MYVCLGENVVVPASGLFYAIGHKPNTDFLENQVKLDEVNREIYTNSPTPFLYPFTPPPCFQDHSHERFFQY